MKKTLLVTLAVTAAAAVPTSAQSLFTSAGMGLPIEPLDGRARALGNLGIGLPDASLLPTDPSALGRYVLATGIVVMQPSWVDYARDGGVTGTFQGTRFPLMGLAYPVFSGMMTVQLGSYLDQRYRTEVEGSIELQDGPVGSVDVFDQRGSVSNLNFGYAKRVDERLSVGASFGRYAGSVVRTFSRSFDDDALGVEDYVESGKWSYVGHSVTLGASWSFGTVAHVAASLQVPTALSAEANEGTEGADGEFDLPKQLRLGASGRLAPGLMLTASASFADWSGAAAGLNEPVTVGDANGFGVGLELTRARLLGKEAPLRFGYRRNGIPFSFEGGDASERVFTGGFGLALNQTGEFLLAGADFGLERGRRTGAGVTEDFWRLTISVTVSGS